MCSPTPVTPGPQPRRPTEPELAAIAVCISGGMGGRTREEAEEELRDQRVAVFDSYITDGPGYTGRVALVLWAGSPGLVQSFGFRDDVAVEFEMEL